MNICGYCGAETSNPKYCSISHAAKINVHLPRKRSPRKRFCPKCGVYRQSGKPCRKHLKDFYRERYLKYIERWLRGEERGFSDRGKLDGRIRRWLLEGCGHKCETCGWGEINLTSGRCPVAVDHINGNWRDCRRENLRVMCPNCHSLTPTYGALNKGNGRPDSRKKVD